MKKKPKKVIVIGAANPTIIRLIEDINRAEIDRLSIIGFIDSRHEALGADFYGFPVLGGFESISSFERDEIHLTNTIAGDLAVRRQTTEHFIRLGYSFLNLIHPTVNLNRVTIGDGNLVYENATLHPFVTLGSHNVVSSNSGIAHETRLGDFVFIGPAAYVCGKCTVSSGAYVGVGAKILPRLTLGPDSVIGAGSVVVKSVPAAEMHIGVPARVV